MSKKQKNILLQNIAVTDYAAEGKALARHEGKVIFIAGAVPGDVADIQLTKSKKDWAEGRAVNITTYAADRVEPFCKHFGLCGGCKWQMLPYTKQLQYKQQEAEENLKRIGKLTSDTMFLPIIGAPATTRYRNKLEFTAANKRFLEKPPVPQDDMVTQHIAAVETGHTQEPGAVIKLAGEGAIGYHAPRIFDKVLEIEECFLMDDVNNRIRNTARTVAKEHGMELYDIRAHTGFLRNIIVRNTTQGGLMVNICINYLNEQHLQILIKAILSAAPEITTLLYTVNPKWNDTIYDLEPVVVMGDGFITEKLGDFSFIISPKSFFQTNTAQAENLYKVTEAFAGLTGKEIVYDLYCGTGSIGIFCSSKAKKIIGIELVEDAVKDAVKNAANNGLTNTSFFAGDVLKICSDEFFATNGQPDVVITDPPRAGMHDKLVQKLLDIAAPKIVYVSCNTATQARDVALLSSKYNVVKVQPVDMFPHTHHIESVALLTLK